MEEVRYAIDLVKFLRTRELQTGLGNSVSVGIRIELHSGSYQNQSIFVWNSLDGV